MILSIFRFVRKLLVKKKALAPPPRPVSARVTDDFLAEGCDRDKIALATGYGAYDGR